jgi:hypothetical protein
MIFQEQVLGSSALYRIVIRAGDSADLLDHMLFHSATSPRLERSLPWGVTSAPIAVPLISCSGGIIYHSWMD